MIPLGILPSESAPQWKLHQDVLQYLLRERYWKPVADQILAAMVVHDRARAVAYLSVDLVDPSPESRNSRQRYDVASINELATSIQEHGVMQPILVSPKGDGRYDTIFGNRGLLASRRAGNAEIPAVVRDAVTERETFVWNLVEKHSAPGT